MSKRRAHAGDATCSADYSDRVPSDRAEAAMLRRQCRQGTERNRRALQAAGYHRLTEKEPDDEDQA